MILNNKITSNGYAIALFSKEVLKKRLLEDKVKKKNLTKLFDESEDFSKKIMITGTFLPIVTASFNDYFFDIYENESSFFKEDQWVKVKEIEGFNLEVDEGELWVVAINQLGNWSYKKFKTEESTFSYEVLDGVDDDIKNVYEAQKKKVSKGKYIVTVTGYERKDSLDSREENFGFGFHLKKVDNLLSLEEISQDNTFNID
ncbi:hypothetical protein [Tenacibaculum ovolyticum]|uniref:hypothetical protein n=1 Tax=Tenacibaculum ovolyticum TaxID=104270 RepID=UPI0003F591C4|nr:hypothetical protein [Tenacibaculum ovolyticum]